MADKFKFEVIIFMCACLTGVLCKELATAKILSSTLLYGGILGIAILLFLMSFFTSISIHGVEDKKSRKDERVFYSILGTFTLIAMLMLILFEAEPIIFWITTCVLWYLTCTIRIVLLWDWF